MGKHCVHGTRWERAAYRVGWGTSRAWTRLNRSGWWRPYYAWWLAGQVASGRYSPAEAWWFWRVYPRAQRDSRRRADVVRRVRRLDGSTAAVAIAGGRLSRTHLRTTRRQPWVYGRHAVTTDAPPGWPVRRWRVARWIRAAVADRSIRPAAVPAAWSIACAAADGIEPLPSRHGRHRRPVPNESR